MVRGPLGSIPVAPTYDNRRKSILFSLLDRSGSPGLAVHEQAANLPKKKAGDRIGNPRAECSRQGSQIESGNNRNSFLSTRDLP